MIPTTTDKLTSVKSKSVWFRLKMNGEITTVLVIVNILNALKLSLVQNVPVLGIVKTSIISLLMSSLTMIPTVTLTSISVTKLMEIT